MIRICHETVELGWQIQRHICILFHTKRSRIQESLNKRLRWREGQEGNESEYPQVSDGPYGYQRHPEYLHASGTDRCGAGAGTHAERSQNERGDLAQKAAQEVGWGIGQEEKTAKPQKSNVDKTRFLTHFRGRFINILSTLKSKICKEMPVYAGFQ